MFSLCPSNVVILDERLKVKSREAHLKMTTEDLRDIALVSHIS